MLYLFKYTIGPKIDVFTVPNLHFTKDSYIKAH